MNERAKKYVKKSVAFLLALSALAGGTLAIIQLTEVVRKESIAEYSSPYIPLVYADVVEFRKFQDENAGKKVRFNTEVSFDAVLAVNLIAHEVCNYDEFLDVVRSDPAKIEKTNIGLMKFKEGFVDPQDTYFYNDKEKRYEFGETSIGRVSCYDSLRIKMKDPSRLRFSYGGTGTISLPLEGLFVVEVRYFSGPSVEYTLREI